MTASMDRAHSSRGEKLLGRMRRSRHGWGQKDLRRVYESYGFVAHERRNHVFYNHPDHSGVRGSVPRHGNLRSWVVDMAIEAIDEVRRREGGAMDDGDS